ncbi:MAG: hypothetical protein QW600_01790 [Candidatus Bathyarchaeia archaeon]|nr:hypothetical protein [Candidatus Bathyarchaeota archaeon]
MSYRQRAVTCPKCGFQFDILYARTISCQGCNRILSSLSCEYVKCPRCEFEFPLSRSAAKAANVLKRWRPSI